jgi:CheY-like chemotaxis protein
MRELTAQVEEQRSQLERQARELESVVEARTRELRAANQAKDEFMATLSHELRTPLNAMLGWVRLLRDGRLDAVTAARALETVERNTRLQAQLIDDLLDVSRIVSGKLRLEMRTVPLEPILTTVLEAIRPAADAKAIRLTSVVEPVGHVVADPARLQQVVSNLLSNAVKFTPRGGSVEVRLERPAAHVDLTVRDSGQGIDREFLPYIFDAFRQADSSATRSYRGLGLGLAIVRHLVELHGGTVAAESPGRGQGATFTVTLPIAGPDAGAGRRAAPDSGHGLREPRLDGVRVLIVEDERDSRELFRTILEQCGARVTAAASADEARAALAGGPPHVLVSDIGMPDEDGYELIRRIRTLEPECGGSVPAIAVTAYAKEEDADRALAAGYDMHVAKPIEPSVLVEAVARVAWRNGRADRDAGAPGSPARASE